MAKHNVHSELTSLALLQLSQERSSAVEFALHAIWGLTLVLDAPLYLSFTLFTGWWRPRERGRRGDPDKHQRSREHRAGIESALRAILNFPSAPDGAAIVVG